MTPRLNRAEMQGMVTTYPESSEMSNYIRHFIYQGTQQTILVREASAPVSARFDPYLALHRGVRDSLAAALSALGSAEPVSGTSLRALLDRIDLAIDLHLAVAALEERHLHPMLEELSADLTRHAAADHEESCTAAQSLRLSLQALRAQLGGAAADAALQALEQEFAGYCADAVCHMQRERAAHNPLLWLHETDQTLRHVQARMLDDVPQHLRCSLAAWMSLASRPSDRSALLESLRRRVPGEAFDMVLDQLHRWSGMSCAPVSRAA